MCIWCEDDNNHICHHSDIVPVDRVAIEAIESLDGLGVSVRERRCQNRRHQAAEKCLSCDLQKLADLKGSFYALTECLNLNGTREGVGLGTGNKDDILHRRTEGREASAHKNVRNPKRPLTPH